MRLCTLFLLAMSSVAATTVHVPTDQPSIQAGIDAAIEGDTVLVSCGTYYEHSIVINKHLFLRSVTGDPACVTVNAEWAGPCARFSSIGPLVVEGITFKWGYSDNGGGDLPPIM